MQVTKTRDLQTCGLYSTFIVWPVGRSENPGMPVLFGVHYLPSLVEIGLTDLPKSGGCHGMPGTPRDDRPDS